MHMIIHYMRILLESRKFFINVSVMFRNLGWDGMRPQCCSFGIWGMGGTTCTHHTTFGKREVEVHSIVGGSFGEGLVGWNILLLMCAMQGSHHDIFGWRWRAYMGEGMSMHDSFGLGKGRNRTLHIEPMKRVAKAHNIKSTMHRAQRWRIQKHKIGIKLEKRVSMRHNSERLPNKRQSLIALEDKREITKAKGLKEHRGGYDMKTTTGMGHKRFTHQHNLQYYFYILYYYFHICGANQDIRVLPDVREGCLEADDTTMGEKDMPKGNLLNKETDYNVVMLNKEYTGNSILDNLSPMDSQGNIQLVDEEGETEVTSDQSDKHKAFVSNDIEVQGNSLQQSFDISLCSMQRSEIVEWEIICLRPMNIKWPEKWGPSTGQDVDNKVWSTTVNCAKERWKKQDVEAGIGAYSSMIKQLSNQEGNDKACFFEKYNAIVECLAKWWGSHKLNDHEVWRKSKGATGLPSRWLDVDRDACYPEENNHRRKKKKRKSKGSNPFTNTKNKATEAEGMDMGDTIGEENRKKHKIWFSRNRRPSKNLALKKVTFSQEAIPMNASVHLMGLGEFKMGQTISKIKTQKEEPKKSHMSRLNSLFEELEAKKEKLKEIVANINTTDENKVLVNSILGMKSFKVLKFSAKLNEDGKVTIDENMIEVDQDPNIGMSISTDVPQPTYASRLSGQTSNSTLNNVIDHRKPKEQNPPEKEPYIKMVETSNRFVLLDRERKELHDTEEAMDTSSIGQCSTYKQGNERWAKKQERVINTKYANLINQDKRYEVKRYIIDRLVPLESTLSEWSRPMLEYFRHLCSIYEFGEGSLAVTYEKIGMLDPLNSGEINNEIAMDEVESEVDGTAGMMRSDAPPYSTTAEPLVEATSNSSKSNPTTVIMSEVQSVGKD
ncbi:hypothetical protein L1987_84557 [Smallanthus sonchifolius]|uniref:Uncharacterized protein n=1 Tax=Smallanthus sonchifolius TaxID=185202 RepID=A0ACB8YJ96_9ASTR|nr:hypothetical protein L1987_84557 [Smallanthus sonchifolius]